MSKPIKFYNDLMSQPARALYIFLKMTKIPYENCPIAIRKGEHMTDEYRDNVNRFKKIPCIVDNDFKLAESVAIFRYLVRQYPTSVADHWYPKDSRARARVDEYLEWQHMNTRLHCSGYFWLKYLLPTMMGKVASESRLAEAKKQMDQTLDFLSSVWLNPSKQKFIAGNEISVADLLAICELEQTRLAGVDPCEGRPNIKLWMDLVKQETQPHYDDAHLILNKVLRSAKL